MAFTAEELKISAKVKRHLKQLAGGSKTKLRLVQRAQILLYAAAGYSNAWIAAHLCISPDTCSEWRGRFVNEAGKLQAIEKAAPEELDMEIQNILTDVPQTGRRRIFSGEQIAFTMKRACQKPSKFGYERAQWTCALLAVEAVRSEAEH